MDQCKGDFPLQLQWNGRVNKLDEFADTYIEDKLDKNSKIFNH